LSPNVRVLIEVLKFLHELHHTLIPIRIKILDINPIAIPKKKVISILITVPNTIMPTCRTSADTVPVFLLSIDIADRILYRTFLKTLDY